MYNALYNFQLSVTCHIAGEEITINILVTNSKQDKSKLSKFSCISYNF